MAKFKEVNACPPVEETLTLARVQEIYEKRKDFEITPGRQKQEGAKREKRRNVLSQLSGVHLLLY